MERDFWAFPSCDKDAIGLDELVLVNLDES
jgi:hypothetical protein